MYKGQEVQKEKHALFSIKEMQSCQMVKGKSYMVNSVTYILLSS